jgi:hypothetical protein
MVANEARAHRDSSERESLWPRALPLILRRLERLERLEPVGLFRATRTAWRENSNLVNQVADFATVQRVVKELNLTK